MNFSFLPNTSLCIRWQRTKNGVGKGELRVVRDTTGFSTTEPLKL